ncbi:hypothetical protein E2C01_001498 [Portunus trituberculatus]|uniref:Uncharacterized protein n=1 Tax=Portunus trituberculatus TaxID=210409 RepID=A0A5B7CGS6_PORTR|nr:hypothetical protein [Portunus trituberculatus]
MEPDNKINTKTESAPRRHPTRLSAGKHEASRGTLLAMCRSLGVWATPVKPRHPREMGQGLDGRGGRGVKRWVGNRKKGGEGKGVGASAPCILSNHVVQRMVQCSGWLLSSTLGKRTP